MSNQKYEPPMGAPPQYPPQAHGETGPFYPPNPSASPQPGAMNQMYPYSGPQDQRGYYGQPDQNYQNYNQGPWPQQQQQYGYYGPPQGGMYYQQGPPPGGYYDNRGARSGAGEGICAGLLGALACCCCLDFLF